jgi:hypothetical protein
MSESTSVPRMSIRSFTIDSPDPYRIALWWCQAFGVPPSPEDFPGDPAALCELPEGPRLLFERVPEGTRALVVTPSDLQRCGPGLSAVPAQVPNRTSG